MENYQEAVAQNNRGVAYMGDNIKTSKALFGNAARALLNKDMPSSEALSHMNAGALRGELSDHISSKDINAHCNQGTLDTVVPDTFLLALNLSPSETAYSLDPQDNMYIASAIVVFNLGIAYHRHGLELEESGQAGLQMLRSGRSFYLKSQVLLQNIGATTSKSSGNALIDFMHLSILNNLGHIASHLSELETSKGYFGLLILFGTTVNHEANDAILGPLKLSYLSSALATLYPSAESACAA
jgi:hypothetical protein